MDNNEELEIQHRNLIEEEEIVISELPIEIKKQMRDFNEKLKEYEETEDEDLFFELQQDDVLIADNIVTYLEDLEGDDDEDEEENDDDENDGDDDNDDEDDEDEEDEEDDEPANNAGILEQRVRALLKGNLISVDDLTRAINREPDYPMEKVGSIRLKKQYLKPFYEVI